MVTGYEVKMYADITRIADQLTRIADSLETGLRLAQTIGGAWIAEVEVEETRRGRWVRDEDIDEMVPPDPDKSAYHRESE